VLRWSLVPLLVVHLCVPPAALMSLLPTASAEAVPRAAKVCPCSGKVGCNCCGCATDEEAAEDEKPAPIDPVSGSVHCRCSSPAELWSASVFVPGADVSCCILSQPAPEWVGSLQVGELLDIISNLDPPPPR
jgi:hypothetical protein